MAERPPVVTPSRPTLEFSSERVAEFLKVLEVMAAGDTAKRLVISDRHDELDAVAHGINVLVGELAWATKRVLEAQEERAASAERASASKNAFLRNMSHEIRTPIAAMLGFAELLASAGLERHDRPELLSRLQANGLAVMSLLDDLLDLARLDARKIVLTPEPVSLIDLVRDVLGSLEIDARAKGLQMRIDTTSEALGSLVTDRFRLRQILVNLVANAVKFTEAGSIVVSVRATHALDDGYWTIDITDTGIGITADQRAHLFEPFEQANASIARAYGGNGLGLALSRRLADQLGGTLVLAESAPGEGTTFRLTLRPLKAEPRESPPGGAAPERSTRAIAGIRILLAEDHRDLHYALRESLQREGATVESAHDGREAVTKIMSAAFDVVLMDLRMPTMDGIQATRALRKQGCALPIIALTADPATLRRAEALDAGCDACLSKPFKIDDLIASIRLSTRLPAV
jgi:signal transduction histidine kinase